MKWKSRNRSYFPAYEKLYLDRYNDLGIGHTMARVLMNRNIDYDAVKTFLEQPESFLKDPAGIPGAKEAAEKIQEYIKTKKYFYIFADYDVDGITSGFIMTDFLRKMGAKADVYYPERKEGYGLNMTFCEKVRKKKDAVVLTVDNGITAFEPIAYLRQHDIPIVVTDHHEPQDKLPDCLICDPWLSRKDKEYVGHHLCGAAVAWKVCLLIDAKKAWRYISYAAVGTVADVMPMAKENAAIVSIGLANLEDYAPNIAYLAQANKIKDGVTSKDVGWTIGPQLNACGRMGNTKLAGELLFADPLDKKNLMELVKQIVMLNDQRKSIKKEALKEAEKQDFSKNKICLFDASKYPVGVAGIIAGTLSDKYGKPAIVYKENPRTGLADGSVRSNGIDILPYLEKEKQEGHIVAYGGHAQACGIQLLKNKKDFVSSMNEALKDVEPPEPELLIDAKIHRSDMRTQLVKDLGKFPSDHQEFSEPVFTMENLKVMKVKASGNNPDNLCFTFKDTEDRSRPFDVWGWGIRPLYDSLGNPKQVDIAGTVSLGSFGKDFGKATFSIQDMRCAK